MGKVSWQELLALNVALAPEARTEAPPLSPHPTRPWNAGLCGDTHPPAQGVELCLQPAASLNCRCLHGRRPEKFFLEPDQK